MRGLLGKNGKISVIEEAISGGVAGASQVRDWWGEYVDNHSILLYYIILDCAMLLRVLLYSIVPCCSMLCCIVLLFYSLLLPIYPLALPPPPFNRSSSLIHWKSLKSDYKYREKLLDWIQAMWDKVPHQSSVNWDYLDYTRAPGRVYCVIFPSRPSTLLPIRTWRVICLGNGRGSSWAHYNYWPQERLQACRPPI